MTEASEAPLETRSLCQIPTTEFRCFHYAKLGSQETVEDEMLAVVAPLAKTPLDEIGILGDIRGRLRNAARGQLPENQDGVIEPVRRHPELWEIKWTLKLKPKRRELLRLYHFEPEGKPELVALRFHRKVTDGIIDEQIEALQEAEMDVAHERALEGKDDLWGHKRRCTGCLLPD